ncbi:MAG: hypothetical protein AB7J13_00375 [Pyrinomonadaceae bacterium]
MQRFLFLSLSVMLLSAAAFAQPRPAARTVSSDAPDQYEARYEGGIFGSSAKEKGNLKFDDANERVVFHRKDGTEMFHIPYDSLVVLYPDSKESTPQSGKVLSKVPVPGFGLFDLMSKSTKYANMTFDDPDIEAKGTASFRFENKKDLVNFIGKLGQKAGMIQRGDAYYRPKKAVF